MNEWPVRARKSPKTFSNLANHTNPTNRAATETATSGRHFYPEPQYLRCQPVTLATLQPAPLFYFQLAWSPAYCHTRLICLVEHFTHREKLSSVYLICKTALPHARHISILTTQICRRVPNFVKIGRFLSRVNMHKRGLCRQAVFVRPSVRLAVCHVRVLCQNK